MARTLSSIPLERSFPPPGSYECKVTDVKNKVSKNKQTPFIELTLFNGESEFTDSLYVTPKTLSRLCLVAKRIGGMADNFQLPDSDTDAANTLASYIVDNVLGKKVLVTIEENEEVFVPDSGPDMGRKVTKKRRRVAFSGYQSLGQDQDTIPF